MIEGNGRRARMLLAAAAIAAVGGRATANDPIPRGYEAVGYGPGGIASPWYGHAAWAAIPYRTRSHLHGYQDYSYGRGPLMNLGGASLQPGFRGYGVFGSPGYGLGMYPSSWIDQRPSWHQGGLFGPGRRPGR